MARPISWTSADASVQALITAASLLKLDPRHHQIRPHQSGCIRGDEVEVRHGLPFSMEIELAGGKSAVSQGGHRG
jgi:hypothetical protein